MIVSERNIKQKLISTPAMFGFFIAMIVLSALLVALMLYVIVGTDQSDDLALKIALCVLFTFSLAMWITLGFLLRFFAIVVIQENEILLKQFGKVLRQCKISEITQVSIVNGYKGSQYIRIQFGNDLVVKKVTKGISEIKNIITFPYTSANLKLVQEMYSGEIKIQK